MLGLMRLSIETVRWLYVMYAKQVCYRIFHYLIIMV